MDKKTKLEKFISAKKCFLITGILLSVPLVGFLDLITGRDLSFSIFYLFPILWTTWSMGDGFGVIIALISVISWANTELISSGYNIKPFVLYWNSGVRLGYFMISLFFLANFKRKFIFEKNSNRIDFLTGIANSRSFFEKAEIEKSRCRRNKTPLTFVYLDCDYFKMINGRFGHKKGDEILWMIAQAMQGSIRLVDTVARIGGDEFLILLPETRAEMAKVVVSRIQKRLLGIMEEHHFAVRFSIGVATFDNPLDSIDQMITKADELMYAAKSDGRDLIRYKEFN